LSKRRTPKSPKDRSGTILPDVDYVYPIEVPYNYPPSNHIACAFKFAKVCHLDTPDKRTLTAPGFFEDYTEVQDVEKFTWPDPAKYLDQDESARRAAAAPADRIKMGILWSAQVNTTTRKMPYIRLGIKNEDILGRYKLGVVNIQ